MHSYGYLYMYWLTFLYCVVLVIMDQVPTQDFISEHISEYIGTPWDMGENFDFKLSREETYVKMLAKEKWVDDTENIVEL